MGMHNVTTSRLKHAAMLVIHGSFFNRIAVAA